MRCSSSDGLQLGNVYGVKFWFQYVVSDGDIEISVSDDTDNQTRTRRLPNDSWLRLANEGLFLYFWNV